MHYEYKVVSIMKLSAEKYAQEMNFYGRDGWKLVCVESNLHYFIKEIKEGTF
ncbi:MAG: DUF4177 domain-containing protein [Clostridia bacterium]|nr:DUF4177 domain-containing protein [Clostridia bacterium]